MDASTWIALADHAIATRRTTADRAWAWAHLARDLALHDLAAALPGSTDAVWVEPQMAWAMDDLADAGARTEPPPHLAQPADLDPGLMPVVLGAALRRLVEIASVEDPWLPIPLADACGYAARRATVAHHAYAGTLP